jgi:hypothetical protein
VARSASRGAHWKRSMAENDQTWETEDTKGKSWQNLQEQSSSVPLTFEHLRQPYQWTNNAGKTERMIPTTGYNTAAAPELDPNPSDDGDDNDSRNNRDRPSRHYRGGGRFPGRYPGNNGNDDRPNRYSGGSGPPDDSGNNSYDDRESEDSDEFPHHPYWPPYGIYYHANPPHPSVKVNAADFYGMPYYHYRSGWPRPQEYHYMRQLSGGEDKWV